MREYPGVPEKRFPNGDCLFSLSPDSGKLSKENEVI
ncbi:MAG: hypothetical protein XD77_0649 [Marinimicrobia bacterium 46_47]|nr:MAG: hypothetical protein XD77_0649 [Marinimicrobia bacterium 46_47]KUK90249.1 MAG: hypothetical protein XE04_1536 [Marinimicrobia bacterium 46_43]